MSKRRILTLNKKLLLAAVFTNPGLSAGQLVKLTGVPMDSTENFARIGRSQTNLLPNRAKRQVSDKTMVSYRDGLIETV